MLKATLALSPLSLNKSMSANLYNTGLLDGKPK